MRKCIYVLAQLRVAPALLLVSVFACESSTADHVGSTRASLRVEDCDEDGPSPIVWGDCEAEELQAAGAVCGMLTVPLDHSDPHGEKIRLALSKVEHSVPDEEYQGVALVNPGGPGVSGLPFSLLGAYVPGSVGQAYDWIGFDTRGVGASEPAVRCDEKYFEGPRRRLEPVKGEIEQFWLQRTASYAQACGDNVGELLDHMRTIDIVQDLDAIRKALHAKQINYYGFSYGTYLGQVYASMFPERIRRMVLDSNVDWRRVWHEANLDLGLGVQRVIEMFWTWVAEHDDVYHLGTSQHAVEKAWRAMQEKLYDEPAGGVVGGTEWTGLTFRTGYGPASWPETAGIWAAWERGEPAPLVAAYNKYKTNENEFAVYNAVSCADASYPEWPQYREDYADMAKHAPTVGWALAWYNAPCLSWPAPGATAVHEVGSDDVPPILLLGETLDAATPFDWSLEVRRRFPSSALVATLGGNSHANSLSGNKCVDEHIVAYLAAGKLPERVSGDTYDAACAAAPLPEPTVESESITYTSRERVRFKLGPQR